MMRSGIRLGAIAVVATSAVMLAGCSSGDDPMLVEAANTCHFGSADVVVSGNTLTMQVPFPTDESDTVTGLGGCFADIGMDVVSLGSETDASIDDIYTRAGFVTRGQDGSMSTTLWVGGDQLLSLDDLSEGDEVILQEDVVLD